MVDIVILMIIAVPILAVIDFIWLKERYKKYHGKAPEPYYWLGPCIIEAGCFIAGVFIGRGGW